MIINLLIIISILVPTLLAVAFMTIIERKELAAMQRRVGPNTVGIYGILQPFADALKLILKENIIPAQSNKIIFYLAPVSSLIFSLAGWGIIPYGPGLTISDFSMGILYTLALSSLGVYGVLFAGWAANSKYSFLGSLRATAAMISYELVLSSAILIIILLTGTLNFTKIVEFQESIWLIFPLFIIFIIFFISILAETSRTPFDLQEAESELVGGFFTEHSSVPFVFFFLSEYSSIVLFSSLTSILFLGGYNFIIPFFGLFYNSRPFDVSLHEGLIIQPLLPGGSLLAEEAVNHGLDVNNSITFSKFVQSVLTIFSFSALFLGFKTCLICFMFVLARATFPRIRYDKLMNFCWLNLLPLVVSLIILVPCILICLNYFNEYYLYYLAAALPAGYGLT